ncbi:MAG: hypothetical protein M0019_09785 [Actinomycetota bacterium]|nr:hypothetical protein [Actinomycetota bacterium]
MVARPRPNETHTYRTFWSDLANGSITVQVCDICEVPLAYGTLICADHGDKSISFREAAKSAKVITRTRIERHPHPILDQETPYTIGVVQEEHYGAQIYCRIDEGCGLDCDEVELTTATFGDDVTLIVATSKPKVDS